MCKQIGANLVEGSRVSYTGAVDFKSQQPTCSWIYIMYTADNCILTRFHQQHVVTIIYLQTMDCEQQLPEQ